MSQFTWAVWKLAKGEGRQAQPVRLMMSRPMWRKEVFLAITPPKKRRR